MMSFLNRRLLQPLRAQLTQGVTPGKLALGLAIGLVAGVLPVLGATTLVSAVAAASLRLNQPAVQLANYAASPLQLFLFLPFFQAGARLFGAPPVGFTLAQLQAALAADLGGTVSRFLEANLRAVAAWALVAPVAVLALTWLFRALLVRLPRAAPAPGRP